MFDAIVDRLAFSYVTGDLSGLKRTIFERIITANSHAREKTAYWEEQLSPLNTETKPIAPSPAVWRSINDQLSKEKRPFSWFSWPVTVGAFASVMVITLILNVLAPNKTLPWDYVAVMSSPEKQLYLVAKSRQSDLTLELDWRAPPPSGTIELWAVSKTDGQTRSIGVLGEHQQILLSSDNWRLIKDAHELIATLEEDGGSSTGEPSEYWIARGLCARFTKG